MLYNEINVVEYLTTLYFSGIGYSSINSARSALSTFIVNDVGLSIGNSPIVKRFMKGVFELRPSQPKYKFIWDVKIVLDFLQNYFPNDELPLSILTYKCVTLLALSSMQRVQTLQVIKVDNIKMYDNSITILIDSILKQSRPKSHGISLVLKPYPHNEAICVCSVLKCYLRRTKALRSSNKQLFISFRKPYLPVSRATISRWIKSVLYEAGINILMFSSHSTRAAAASAAHRESLYVDDIINKAGWANCHVFHKFYNKVIVPV